MTTKSLTHNSFHAIILPTESCNFRCTYCYESFSAGKMPKDIQRAVVSFLLRKIDSVDNLFLSWFGGEPLLAMNVIREISLPIIEKIHNFPDKAFIADITTNAYILTPTLFEELLSVGVNKFQITFDGPEIDHNKTRIQKNGKGTFETIWKNILMAKKINKDFQILLRIHYHNENCQSIPGFKDVLLKAFGGDKRFKIFFRPISKLGGKNDASFPVCSDEEIADYNGLFNSLPNENQYILTEENPICYASRPDSFVFRANGSLSKCTARLDCEANIVGNIDKNGNIQANSEILTPWIEGFIQKDLDKRRCPARFI